MLFMAIHALIGRKSLVATVIAGAIPLVSFDHSLLGNASSA